MYILEHFTLNWLDGARAEKYRQETVDKREETGIALLKFFIAPNHPPKIITGYIREEGGWGSVLVGTRSRDK